jgi:hypothetical protein
MNLLFSIAGFLTGTALGLIPVGVFYILSEASPVSGESFSFFVEKVGLPVGILLTACALLLRWLQSSHSELVKILVETIKINTETLVRATEALIRVSEILNRLAKELERLERENEQLRREVQQRAIAKNHE